jgi:hypothetical protein
MAKRRLPAVAKCARVCHAVSRMRMPYAMPYAMRLRLPLSAPSAESCWRVEHWTPRRASRSGVVAPDAAIPWCVQVCQRAAWPSLKHATSNRVFVIRADKGGGPSAFCDYACTTPARTGKGILPVYAPCTPSVGGRGSYVSTRPYRGTRPRASNLWWTHPTFLRRSL